MSSLLWLLIIGAVAGWLAGQLVKGHGFGIWVDMIVGVVGAFIGRYLLLAIGIMTFGLIGELIASLVGAVALVLVIKMFTGRMAENK